jgi:hypothetical protein
MFYQTAKNTLKKKLVVIVPISIDTDERIKVTVGISVLSVIVFYIIMHILKKHNISFPYIGEPSLMGLFWGLYKIFDKYAWKCNLLRRIGIVKTPILEGNWKGNYHSKRRCDKTNEILENTGEVELTIEQTWTKIRIKQASDTSTSCSELAGIAINDNMGIVLRYQYRNESKFKNIETMYSHSGFNKLLYLPKKETLEGDYFTDKSRQTYGSLVYKKI